MRILESEWKMTFSAPIYSLLLMKIEKNLKMQISTKRKEEERFMIF